MKKIFLGIGIVVFAISAYIFYWIFFGYREPQFFPLDDVHASYQITQDTQGTYSVYYSGKSPFNINSVLIGNSKFNVEIFVGKNVKVTGEFVSSDKQCIADVCKNIYGPYVVLDIYSIKEK